MSPSSKKKKNGKDSISIGLRIPLWAKIAVSATLLLLIISSIGPSKILSEISKINSFFLSLALFFVVFQIFFKALKWMEIIKAYGVSLSLWKSISYTCISIAFGMVTPARAGEAIKGAYLRSETKLPIGKSLATVFFDKAFDLLSIFLLGTLGLLLMGKFVPFREAYLSLFILLFLFVLSLVLFSEKTISIAAKILPKKIGEMLLGLSLDQGAFIKAFLFSFVVWAIYVIEASLILLGLGIESPPVFGIAVMVSLMALSSAFPFTLGGIGIREAVSLSFLLILGIPKETSAAFALLYSAVSSGPVSLLGVIFYIGEKENGKRGRPKKSLKAS